MPRKRTGNIQDRGTSFRIRYTDAAGRRQYETYATRDEAERQLAIRLGELASGVPVSSKPNTVLFGELADDVVTDYETNNFRSTDDIEARFRVHLVPAFGMMRVANITTADIQRYIRRRQNDGAKAGTINRELEAMRHAFNLAIKGRKLLHAPHVPRLREDNVRTGFFTPAEVDRLCKVLPAPFASVVRFAFLTGWRYGEVIGLEWRSVDFERGSIRLDAGTTKNRKGRVFPMSEELERLLESRARAAAGVKTNSKIPPATAAARAAIRSPFVFSVNGKQIGSFKKTWKTACYKAGIPCVVAPVKKGGRPGAVKIIKCSRTFHDLRRSAAKNLVAQGIPERVVMEMCGWLTRSVFDRYQIVGEADLAAAREKMDAHALSSRVSKKSERA